MPRRPRILSPDELHLWGEIAKLVTPLRGQTLPLAVSRIPMGKATRIETVAPPITSPGHGAPSLRAQLVPSSSKRPVKLAELAPAQPAKAPVSPFAVRLVGPAGPPLEKRERRGLARGTLAIEARIDLHGLRQTEAHAALVGFVSRARAAGMTRVLVVTGKGGVDEHGLFADRGVLRRSVPHWLRGPELRASVLGFEEAARHHGGAGALYVRLKRR